jgi:hypothetical protein
MDAPTMIRCYRGVSEGHIFYQDALQGIARPRGGSATPAKHNEGNTESEYTSWTTDHRVAHKKALESDFVGRGVILQKDFDEVEIVLSPDIYFESEVLIRGLVKDALVVEVP